MSKDMPAEPAPTPALVTWWPLGLRDQVLVLRQGIDYRQKGVIVGLDQGQAWVRFHGNLPVSHGTFGLDELSCATV